MTETSNTFFKLEFINFEFWNSSIFEIGKPSFKMNAIKCIISKKNDNPILQIIDTNNCLHSTT